MMTTGPATEKKMVDMHQLFSIADHRHPLRWFQSVLEPPPTLNQENTVNLPHTAFEGDYYNEIYKDNVGEECVSVDKGSDIMEEMDDDGGNGNYDTLGENENNNQ